MNEILNLLNKYDSPKTIYSRGTHMWQFFGINNVFVREGRDEIKWLTHAQLISKGYGFIKWLLDNNKIYCKDLDYKYLSKKYSDYESLLMLLSIQDDPIDFLVSILR